MQIRRILCPVDFSDPAREALHFAAELARQFNASMTLLHVYHPPGYTLPEGIVLPGPEALASLFEHIDRTLAEWRNEALARGAPEVDTATAQGSPWHEIVECARRRDFHMIVVGTHGHTGLRHLLLGSVADRVVRQAPCPVLTVRPADHRLE
jgi:nucleotide-binding universal stress UspA family protein